MFVRPEEVGDSDRETEMPMLSRRDFAKTILATAGPLAFFPAARASGQERKQRWESTFKRIEAESLGRLGVAVLDRRDGFSASLRGSERFPMCSTFKMLAAAAVLDKKDRGLLSLDKTVTFAAKDVVANSPVTKDHVGIPMTLAELCEAALTQSDNTAGNMLLREIDGPAGLTDYIRSLGDRVSRLDRWGVELNEAASDDLRDTTTPEAMLSNMQQLLLGDLLSGESRSRLVGWMVANKTGATRLRAGVPSEWKVADKTGAGERGTTNDIGILWPPQSEPILISVYLTGSSRTPEDRNAIIAKVARIVAESS
jgi:beta-lactamase class A